MDHTIIVVNIYPVGDFYLLLNACGNWSLVDIRDVDTEELEAEIKRLRSLL